MRNDTTTGRVSVCIRALVRYDFRAQNTGVKAHSGDLSCRLSLRASASQSARYALCFISEKLTKTGP